jgi:hypothetical protein
MRRALMIVMAIALASPACNRSADAPPTGPSAVVPGASAERLFADDFESGTLDAWQDGFNSALHRVVSDQSTAQSGSRYLAVTFPQGRDGGWLTRFLMPGGDSAYVSYYVRFPAGWKGGPKLVGFYGSRIDDQWSAFGKAGLCPNGSDFFAAMLVTEDTGDPGPVRFYTYYPAMRREPNGITCWGRYGDGAETYVPPLTLSPNAWHRVELSVQLNTPGQADGRQMFWIDGVQRGSWSGISFRQTDALRLNAVQLTFSFTGGVARPQELHVDNLVVLASRP